MKRMLVSPSICLGWNRWMYHNVSVHSFLIYCLDPSTSPLQVIGVDDGGHIDELKRHTDRRIMQSECAYTSSLCSLSCSQRPNDMNILIDKNGSIAGVVDWEYQDLHPAALQVAASYPPWLSYDGCNDPRFVNPKQIFWSAQIVC